MRKLKRDALIVYTIKFGRIKNQNNRVCIYSEYKKY